MSTSPLHSPCSQVNFMMDDWLPYAQAAATRYRLLGKEPVVDLDSILVHASQVILLHARLLCGAEG